MLPTLAGTLLSYLLGSIPFGLLVARAKGVDLRKVGSGNVGATNVVRTLGKPLGFTVFALDFLKGLVPTLVGRTESDAVALLFGIAAVLGHVFPVWLKFKGGKGVATSAGFCAGLAPLAVAISFLLWFALLKATRYVSLASMVAAVAFPAVFITIEGPAAAFGERRLVTLVGVLLAAGILFTHRANIARLLRGEEHRAGSPRAGDKRS